MSDLSLGVSTWCFNGLAAAEIRPIVDAGAPLVSEHRPAVSAYFRELAATVLKTGVAYTIPGSRLAARETRGLPPLPKTNLDDLKKLAKVTHLDKSLGKA